MENRHGLVVDGLVSRATGEAERLAAEAMLLLRPNWRRRITLGADKGYDAADSTVFVIAAGNSGADSTIGSGCPRPSSPAVCSMRVPIAPPAPSASALDPAARDHRTGKAARSSGPRFGAGQPNFDRYASHRPTVPSV